ncbi:MAG: NAD-dependent epimerase/dehydratase family protein [Syntrophomonadaceae bacterium]|jgi:nucleoside-diphosphate-sugar epimerase/SAM-dependent methyltransferase
MNILISGVTSFLGMYTAEKLLGEGHTVVGIVRPGSTHESRLQREELAGLRIAHFDFDMLPEEDTVVYHRAAELVQPGQFDVWIHFAWDGEGSLGRSNAEIQKRNIANAKKAYRIAEALSCRKFLFAGSQAEYGRGSHQAPAPVSEYGKAKLAFGRWATDESLLNEVLSDTPGEVMQALHLRIYSVYGYGDHETSLVNSLIRSVLRREEISLGPCTQRWNYMEVKDCARAISLLANSSHARTGEYDIAGDETKPLRSFVEDIVDICEQIPDLKGKKTTYNKHFLHFGARLNNTEGAADMAPDVSLLKAIGFRQTINFNKGIRKLAEKLRLDLLEAAKTAPANAKAAMDTDAHSADGCNIVAELGAHAGTYTDDRGSIPEDFAIDTDSSTGNFDRAPESLESKKKGNNRMSLEKYEEKHALCGVVHDGKTRNIPKLRPSARCIACGSRLQPLMTFDNMPASAQDIPDESELSKDHPISLTLCQCGHCGLVQFDTEPVHYYKDVIRAGGGSSTMRALRREEYQRLLDTMERKGLTGRNIIEVGCGRGEFLSFFREYKDELLQEQKNLMEEPQGTSLEIEPGKTSGAEQPTESNPAATRLSEPDQSAVIGDKTNEIGVTVTGYRPEAIRLTGIEHKPELVELARQAGLEVYEGFAEGDETFPNAPFDAFVQFNFLEHQPHPKDMLHCIWENLKPGAIGLVTVPSFEYILKYDGYYELLRDHIAYYTKDTLRRLFESAGFRTLSERTVNRDTLEILVEKLPELPQEAEPYTGGFTDVSALMENYETLRRDITKYLDQLDAAGRTLAIWGASHQGFTLAATTGLGGRVRYIIDSAKFKQGRFAPASHIPIYAPEHFLDEPVDEILIVAPGYTDEIAGIIRDKFGRDIRILVLKSEKITDYEAKV